MFDDVASAYITHDYVLDGTKILSETVTDAAYGNSYTLYYVYDADGSITGLHYNGAPYYFQKNIQGDVLRICNASGAVVVEYTYDAWGNILSTTGSMANTLGQYNPFRYRGYHYDSETDLYYLNSRYYDAEVGRFLNQDVYISTGEGIRGYNMFAYCLNNPVTRTDISGADSVSVTEGDDDNPMDDLGASNLGVGGGSGGVLSNAQLKNFGTPGNSSGFRVVEGTHTDAVSFVESQTNGITMYTPGKFLGTNMYGVEFRFYANYNKNYTSIRINGVPGLTGIKFLWPRV